MEAEERIRAKEKELAKVVDEHDDLIREKFHMERFVSLITGFDPKIAKTDKSPVFLNYLSQHDLVNRFAISDTTASNRGSARTTRRALASATTKLALPEVSVKHKAQEPSNGVAGASAIGSHLGNGNDSKQKAMKELEAVEEEIAASAVDPVSTLLPRKRGRQPRVDISLEEHDPQPSLKTPGQRTSIRSKLTPQVEKQDVDLPGPSRKRKAAVQESISLSPSVGQTGKRSKRAVPELNSDRVPPVTIRISKRKIPSPEPELDVQQPVPTETKRGRKRKIASDPPPSQDPFKGIDIPLPRFTHPDQSVSTTNFGGDISQVLNSYVMLEDKEIDHKSLRDQTMAILKARNRARELRRQGRLILAFDDLDDFKDSRINVEAETEDDGPRRQIASVFRPPSEPKRALVHRDHLLLSVSQVRNTILSEYKNGLTISRKIAKLIQTHWERELGKEKRLQVEEEKNRKTSARELAKAVKARWKLAYKIVGARRKEQARKEQERLGQEHLQNILERSLGMLGGGGRQSSVGSPNTSRDLEGEDMVSEEEEDGNTDIEQGEGDDDGEDDEENEKEEDLIDPDDVELDPVDDDQSVESAATDLSTPKDHEPDEADPATVTIVENGEEILRETLISDAVACDTPDAEGDGETVSSDPDEERVEEEDTDEEDYKMDVEMEKDENEQIEDDSEDDGLLADADVPIEELLRRYGYTDDVPVTIPGSKISNGAPFGNGDLPGEDENVVRSSRRRRIRRQPPINDDTDGISDSPSNNLPTPDLISDIDSDVDGVSVEVGTPLSNAPEEHGEALEQEKSSEAEAEAEEESEGEVMDETTSNSGGVRVPFLLRANLRPYQKAGLDWLASAYRDETNVILADDMGLGKTIQTISLLGHLACDLGVWGPHLIIVPTSVILNWEMEFKKFLPGCRVLVYYGNQKERKERRKGWYTEGSFQVCITSYQIVLSDAHIFKKRQWHYMILDEAHNIKNFRSQRWQTLLGFRSHRRLLLTGTPLQNNLMELWSLLYFLMPQGLSDKLTEAGGFANHREFIDWFSNPMEKAVEIGDVMSDEVRATVDKLHLILRPYMLRRLKSEVEKELPPKVEHDVYCNLSKRQRFLYDEFIARGSTRESLTSGGYLGVANVLMKLRQVCNHPDLFEVRPIKTSFAMEHSVAYDFLGTALTCTIDSLRENASHLSPIFNSEFKNGQITRAQNQLDGSDFLSSQYPELDPNEVAPLYDTRTLPGWRLYLGYLERQTRLTRWQLMERINRIKCSEEPVYGTDLLSAVDIHAPAPRGTSSTADLIQKTLIKDSRFNGTLSPEGLLGFMRPFIDKFAVITPNVITRDLAGLSLPSNLMDLHSLISEPEFDTLHTPSVKLQIAFPDKSLLQFDCGKLQTLYTMLRDLKTNGHRVLIFTNMTKMLDILEIFLNYAGHRYFRLDGSTKVEERLGLTERFNTNEKVFAFIASTRSGGVGINLTGADTVIFYDNDFNPAMDKQAMDRAHRIGQTREVHVYRLITSHTIEENMLKKANQKKLLERMVIQQGDFTTDFLVGGGGVGGGGAGKGAGMGMGMAMGMGGGKGRDELRDVLGVDILGDIQSSTPQPEGTQRGRTEEKDSREIQRALEQVLDEEDLEADKVDRLNEREDMVDFGVMVGEGGSRSGSGSGVGGGERGAGGEGEGRSPAVVGFEDSVDSSPGLGETPGLRTGDQAEEDFDQMEGEGEGEGEKEEDDDEGEPGGIDEYMLRFVEWEWDQ